MVLSGNTSVSNFSTSSSFRIRKSIGRGYSSQSSQVFGLVLPPPILLLTPPPWSSSHCSVTATSLPLSPLPQLAPHCSLFRAPSLVAIQKPPSVTPVLLAIANAALAHPPATPHHSHLHTPSHPAIGHRFVPRHRSSVQVYTLTS